MPVFLAHFMALHLSLSLIHFLHPVCHLGTTFCVDVPTPPLLLLQTPPIHPSTPTLSSPRLMMEEQSLIKVKQEQELLIAKLSDSSSGLAF